MSGPREGGPPPWINDRMQQLIEWRDGDIIVSVPVKSGTTWTMNIVHQLLTGGDADFVDIYAEVPWIEILQRPGQPVQEMLDRVAAMTTDRRRAFKTHAAPPTIPYLESGGDKDLRYIVVLRNPEEALVSLEPFLDKHTDAFYDLWKVPKAAMTRPDFASFYKEVVDRAGMQGMLFGFLRAWWPLRDKDNVLFLHFADMKRDHAGALRRIADFLGIQPSSDQWPAITEYTSFRWMKEHAIKFDASTMTAVPVLEPGAMVRKGAAGAAGEDGMTEEVSQHLRTVGSSICQDETALEWLYSGGPLPGC